MAASTSFCSNPTVPHGEFALLFKDHSTNHFYYRLNCDFLYTRAYKGQSREFICIEEDNSTRWTDNLEKDTNKPTCILDVITMCVGVGLGVAIPLIIAIICLARVHQKEKVKNKILRSRSPQLPGRTSADAMNEYYRRNRTDFPTYDDIDDINNCEVDSWPSELPSSNQNERNQEVSISSEVYLKSQQRKGKVYPQHNSSTHLQTNPMRISRYTPKSLQRTAENIPMREISGGNNGGHLYDNNPRDLDQRTPTLSNGYRQFQAQESDQQRDNPPENSEEPVNNAVRGKSRELGQQEVTTQEPQRNKRESLSGWLLHL